MKSTRETGGCGDRPVSLAASMGLVVLLLAIVVAFTMLGLAQSRGLQDDVTIAEATGDDWLMYKGMALSILDEGWTIPAVHTDYFRPAGFLYNYFVAAVFAALGRNSVQVYRVQAVLLGLSVVVMTLAFRAYLQPASQYLLAGTLAVAAYLDVFRNYTFRLLSENLVIFLLACFWLLLTWSLRRRENWIVALACGFVFGMCGLTRPNVLLLAPVQVLALWLLPAGLSRRQVVLFVVGLVASTSLMVVRNYAVTGEFSFVVVSGGLGGTQWMGHQPGGSTPGPLVRAARSIAELVAFYGRRVLYSMGFLSFLRTDYRIRPHWVLAWIGVAVFIWMKRTSLEAWEWLVIVFIAGYLVPLYAVGGLESYGYRMLLPVVPLLMLLAIRAIDLRLAPRGGVVTPTVTSD